MRRRACHDAVRRVSIARLAEQASDAISKAQQHASSIHFTTSTNQPTNFTCGLCCRRYLTGLA